MTPFPPLVTLITDFGLADEYVGVVKGIILSHNAAIRIVDISHSVPPQDIRTAAHLLSRSYAFFPADTVHLVIVDPGVGSDRPILAIRANGHTFVGPDNGIFTAILNNTAGSLAVYQVTESELFLGRVSNTFHGRDIMAPVAARLATGMAIDRVGPPVSPAVCLRSDPGKCAVINSVLTGEITHVDRFGNLCTNISRDDVQEFTGGNNVILHTGKNTAIAGDAMCTSYADRPKGSLLILYDSHGFLEIAENMGNASQRLHAHAGDRVFLAVN